MNAGNGWINKGEGFPYKLHPVIMCLYVYDVWTCIETCHTLWCWCGVPLQKPVFEGVAQEVLAECVRSLQFASDAIKNKKVRRHNWVRKWPSTIAVLDW